MKTVKTKVTSYTINAAKVSCENGEVFTEDLEPLTITDKKVTEQNAVKLFCAKRGYITGNSAMIIKSIDVNERVLEMPLDDFVKFYDIWQNGTWTNPDLSEQAG